MDFVIGKYADDIGRRVKWDASSRWPSSLYRSMRIWGQMMVNFVSFKVLLNFYSWYKLGYVGPIEDSSQFARV